MAEFIAGPTAILQWISVPGGTISLAADYRTFQWTPSVNFVDISAGQDTNVGRLTALKDANASVTLVGQTGGTLMIAALQPGVGGTLIFGPEGTASGKRKVSIPCFSNGVVTDAPYAGEYALSCGFTGNGAYTDGSY